MSVSSYLFGGDATKGMANGPAHGRQIGHYLTAFADQPAPMQDTSQSNQARGGQQSLADMLMRTAQGQQQGPGELAVRRAANSAMSQQTSAAQMARGANAALAARNAARNNASIGVNAAGQAGIAHLNDTTAAQNQLSQLLGIQRGQDIQVAGANQQSQLAQQGQDLQAMAQLLGVDVATLQQDLAKRGINMQDKGMMGQLLQIGGQIGAAYAGAPRTSNNYSGTPGA